MVSVTLVTVNYQLPLIDTSDIFADNINEWAQDAVSSSGSSARVVLRDLANITLYINSSEVDILYAQTAAVLQQATQQVLCATASYCAVALTNVRPDALTWSWSRRRLHTRARVKRQLGTQQVPYDTISFSMSRTRDAAHAATWSMGMPLERQLQDVLSEGPLSRYASRVTVGKTVLVELSADIFIAESSGVQFAAGWNATATLVLRSLANTSALRSNLAASLARPDIAVELSPITLRNLDADTPATFLAIGVDDGKGDAGTATAIVIVAVVGLAVVAAGRYCCRNGLQSGRQGSEVDVQVATEISSTPRLKGASAFEHFHHGHQVMVSVTSLLTFAAKHRGKSCRTEQTTEAGHICERPGSCVAEAVNAINASAEFPEFLIQPSNELDEPGDGGSVTNEQLGSLADNEKPRECSCMPAVVRADVLSDDGVELEGMASGPQPFYEAPSSPGMSPHEHDSRFAIGRETSMPVASPSPSNTVPSYREPCTPFGVVCAASARVSYSCSASPPGQYPMQYMGTETSEWF